MPNFGTGWSFRFRILEGIGPSATGKKMSWPLQPIVSKQPGESVGIVVGLESVVTVVAKMEVDVVGKPMVVVTTTILVCVTKIVLTAQVGTDDPWTSVV